MDDDRERWVTTAEAQEAMREIGFRFSAATVRNWVHTGVVRSKRIGGRYFIHFGSLVDVLNGQDARDA